MTVDGDGVPDGVSTSVVVAIRLPSELVAWIDSALKAGRAESRDDLIAAALKRQRQQWKREERLAALRAALLQTPTLTVAGLAARRSEEEAATYAWLLPLRQDGSVVVIPTDEALVIPAFQFDETGAPIGEVTEVNRTFAATRVRTLWAMWSWWHARTSFLSGERPIELIYTDPERVLTAARREARTDSAG